MPEIEHIVFDLSEVLVNGIVDLPDKIGEHLRGENHNYSDSQISEVFFDANYESLNALFRGEISEELFWRRFIGLGDFPVSVRELKGLARQGFWKFSHSEKTIGTLKAEGYNLVLLSDHGKDWIKYIEQEIGFLQLFDTRCYSFDSHHTKKEKENFDYMINKSGINPKHALFVDDFEINLRISKKAGIGYTHLFRGFPELKKRFDELGISCS